MDVVGAEAQDTSLTLVAVVPARNAEATLGPCLAALVTAGVAADAIVVVDDASQDATPHIAEEAGAQVITTGVPVRPAAARNLGVKQVKADIVLFVDADVVVHQDAVDLVKAAFASPDIVAVFGSYDDAPPDVSVVSRYRNLLHHHVHQTAPRDARTFWTGLGAVRTRAFHDVGGFDASFDFLEDVDLGLRLHAAGGRILLNPAIQGRHLKTWTLRSMIGTDIYGRAIPWMRLMRSGRLPPTELNGAWRHRVSAMCVAVAIISAIFVLIHPGALLLAAAALGVFVAANLPFLRVLGRVGGATFAARALPFHVVHYAAALVGAAIDRFQVFRASIRARDRA